MSTVLLSRAHSAAFAVCTLLTEASELFRSYSPIASRLHYVDLVAIFLFHLSYQKNPFWLFWNILFYTKYLMQFLICFSFLVGDIHCFISSITTLKHFSRNHVVLFQANVSLITGIYRYTSHWSDSSLFGVWPYHFHSSLPKRLLLPSSCPN